MFHGGVGMEFVELFWKASIEDLKRGYSLIERNYVCHYCGMGFEEGVVYTVNGIFFDAKKAVEEHIKSVHGSVFESMMARERKHTGLTELQSELMSGFFSGLDDGEIARKMNINRSTVRNHRFRLKEKARQAKIFLVLFELMEEKIKEEDRMIGVHRGATMIDDRYAITETEREEKIKKFFEEDGILKRFPKKEKDKLIVLMKIAGDFASNRIYSEKEVNEILKRYYEDYVLLRRYLIEYGFIIRKPDGSSYWSIF
jgi:DNA-binding CsgD family transcriptional regulator